MKNIIFQSVGENLERDALALKRLCTDASDDPSIVREFESTVDPYKNLPLSEIHKRITERYIDGQFIGSLVIVEGQEAGFAVAMPAPMPLRKGVEHKHAVNIGLWLLKGYRGKGLGQRAIDHIVQVVSDRVTDPTDHNMFNRMIWTGIANDNFASQKICLKAGFALVSPDWTDDKRSIYAIAQ